MANKKRKSVANTESDSQTGEVKSPKMAKISPLKTPGKPKGIATPFKSNKTPKINVKTPKQENGPKTPQQNQGNASAKKKNNKVSESEASPPNKLKKFGGTSGLGQSQSKKNEQGQGKGPKQQQNEGGKRKKRKGQYSALKEKINAGDKSALQEIEEKLKLFETRKEITKTAQRKLRFLQNLKSKLTGEVKQISLPSQSKKRRERRKVVKGKKKEEGKNSQSEDDSSESDYEVEAEVKPSKIIKTTANVEEKSDDSEEEEEESGEEEEEEGSEGDDDGASDEEEQDEDTSDDEGEEAPEIPKGKISQAGTSPSKDLKNSQSAGKTKTRYIIFAGNLPFDSTKQDIAEHFKKAGQIRHIRIPTEKKTNKPRGFAYVEFDDEVSYQKALSMHHTFIKGRRINVLYTQGGKKKGEERKNQMKIKNFKLQAMRKQGQLAGSVKESQKRAARRGKKNAAKVNGSD